ncbi:MAG: YqaJ viral recombinase family protein [Methanobrevibacter sp.]|nr:YqaJ viral recombinase family protein [Methanobrevibacter sp.]
MKIYTFEQGTPEWFAVRLGKLTASKAQAIGNAGKGLETLCWEKAAEILTGEFAEQIENDDIKRGVELEDEARNAYSLETGKEVKQVGFIEYSDYAGASPDGLVDDDGLTEYKCKNDVNHLKLITSRVVDSKYIWQMQMQMLVAERDWCDFVSYNPRFTNHPLVIMRFHKDPAYQRKLIEGIKIGTDKILEILKTVQ